MQDSNGQLSFIVVSLISGRRLEPKRMAIQSVKDQCDEEDRDVVFGRGLSLWDARDLNGVRQLSRRPHRLIYSIIRLRRGSFMDS